ncbi:MAG: cation transporter [Bacteroidota bacterium]|nr:cation transporter [Bacteroidota bacterium]
MINKPLLKRFYISCIIVVAFAISSCGQQHKRPEKILDKDQAKTAVVQKRKMSVDGMTCSACQASVKNAIKSLDGVTHVEVNLEKKFAFFSYDPLKIKPQQIQDAVNNKGYKAGNPENIKQ